MSAGWRWTGGAALVMAVLAGCGGSGSSEPPPGAAANSAPAPTVLLAGMFESSTIGADVTAVAGSDIKLSGLGSTDADGDALSYKWSIASKPKASRLTLASQSAGEQSVKPDVAGKYVFSLRVTDTKGAFADKKATVAIRPNAAPVANIVVTASYTGVSSTKPVQVLNIGSAVVLDASASTDPDGDVVTTTWAMTEKPAASVAALTVAGQASRFVIDVAGQYKVTARGTDPHGAYRETIYVFQASNSAPQTVVLASVTDEPGTSGASTIAAATGYVVSLDGSTSADPDGSKLAYAWTMSSKPAGSVAAVSNTLGAISQVTPDLLGDYVVKLTATDVAGAASTYITTISVKNSRPLAAITSGGNAPVALPTGPTMRLPVNTVTTLRGTASIDPDGDALSFAWSIAAKPAASAALLTGATASSVQITPDVSGTYTVLLRVTDGGGAFSEQSLNLEVGNYAPVAVADKNRMTLLTGSTATASAALSYDENGDTLSYAWAIDARPLGSLAAIAAPSSAALSFTPDLPGIYVASVTVSDGKNASIAYVTLKVLAAAATSVPLNFVPLEARYSKGLDKLVIVASNPHALKIVDPFTAATRSVILPTGVKSLSLSPDGKLAAVLHEGVVSLVDLDAGTLIRSSPTGGAQTDAFATNAGMLYLIGQTGGQWVDQAVAVIDGRTGVDRSAALGLGTWTFYGTQRGIYAPRKNKVFLMESGLSPADLKFFGIHPTTGAVTGTGDSPYHGDFPMSAPLFLSANEDILFTSSGNYFHTDTLKYAGKFTLSAAVLALSHSSDADELVLLQATGGGYPGYARTYAASYQRFVGSMFLPEGAITLPVIAAAQSYGINIFHSANGNHVALVQTGSATENAAGVQYYVTTR